MVTSTGFTRPGDMKTRSSEMIGGYDITRTGSILELYEKNSPIIHDISQQLVIRQGLVRRGVPSPLLHCPREDKVTQTGNFGNVAQPVEDIIQERRQDLFLHHRDGGLVGQREKNRQLVRFHKDLKDLRVRSQWLERRSENGVTPKPHYALKTYHTAVLDRVRWVAGVTPGTQARAPRNASRAVVALVGRVCTKMASAPGRFRSLGKHRRAVLHDTDRRNDDEHLSSWRILVPPFP
jgi:hypothetical protein